MRVPVSVPIGGRDIRIEYLEQVFDNDGTTVLTGATIGDPTYIQISKSENKTGEAVMRTLYHELNHVALEMTGQHELLSDQQEEAIVCALEHMLGPVICLKSKVGVRYREINFPWE